jgi:plastocyanin
VRARTLAAGAEAPRLSRASSGWLAFRIRQSPMNRIARRQLVRLASVVVGGAFLGCNATPGPASPAGAAPPAAGAAKTPAPAPRIVGTVLSATTHEPIRGGAVVYLEDAPKLPGVATAATMDVDHKEFRPVIAVVTTGGTVTFGNRDALTHHVFSPDIQQWDTGYLRKNDTAGRTFETPGAIAVLCNIHPEMIGYVLVIPSTSFSMVGPEGRYAIAGVPPGTYRATAWAPHMQPATQSVTVGSLGPATVAFELPPAAMKN